MLKAAVHLIFSRCFLAYTIVKGVMGNNYEYKLTVMQYDIHNYVFSGV